MSWFEFTTWWFYYLATLLLTVQRKRALSTRRLSTCTTLFGSGLCAGDHHSTRDWHLWHREKSFVLFSYSSFGVHMSVWSVKFIKKLLERFHRIPHEEFSSCSWRMEHRARHWVLRCVVSVRLCHTVVPWLCVSARGEYSFMRTHSLPLSQGFWRSRGQKSSCSHFSLLSRTSTRPKCFNCSGL